MSKTVTPIFGLTLLGFFVFEVTTVATIIIAASLNQMVLAQFLVGVIAISNIYLAIMMLNDEGLIKK